MKSIIHNGVELSFIQLMGVVSLVNGAIDKIYGGLEKVPQSDLERIRCVVHTPDSNGKISVDVGIRSAW